MPVIQKCELYSSLEYTMTIPVRLARVSGYQGRTNDVVYLYPKMIPADSVVIYFGGDVQDFPENMESHRDNKSYVKWNLENMATILQGKFETSHIVVVRPSRMEFKMFGCYDNFVPCNNTGAPDHTPMHYALLHLDRLVQNISLKLSEQDSTKGLHLDQCDYILIGFSKGCVVLNQILYEFHYLKTLTPDDESLAILASKVIEMYWLDGGHSGGKNSWITSRSLLETLSRLAIIIHIHVTPYQVNDDRRPWIRKEERVFFDSLRKMGAHVNRTYHFENQVPNLRTHFEVLNDFK
ncbi:UPF0565 protein C2orf69 homolog isoform X2 [Cimex lectularius]|uniref:Uncharacterized protein n=1 Tax=Cimex lectularius TaxID=79782 RepID=A0A8I6SCF3_CIMLE|nr:UPF0565 protein C2orf69 homolog isoform X2 [Cimex lectularius]